MPIMHILDEDGRLLKNNRAGAIVWATMLHPSGVKQRDATIAAGEQELLLLREEPIPPDIAKPVFNAGSAGIEKASHTPIDHGFIAGEVLIRVLQLAKHAPEQATIRRARFLVERGRGAACNTTGRLVPGGTSTVEAAWSKFKPVSHLWAAFIPHFVENDGSKFAVNDEFLPDMLSLARWIADLACQHHPPHMGNKSRPILDESQIWAIPDSPDIPDAQYEPPALSEEELGWLSEYARE